MNNTITHTETGFKVEYISKGCECDFPLPRTAENNREYCGLCQKNIE